MPEYPGRPERSDPRESLIARPSRPPTMNLDLLLYPVHGAFWASFAIAGWTLKRKANQSPSEPESAPATETRTTAKFSRSVLAIHFLAFGVMYFGVGNSVIPDRVADWFPGQRIVGTLLIAAGATLMAWARVWFHSWRFRAQLDAGHQLATGGPFALVRHPIYAGLDLLAIGTAVWTPTPITWFAAGLMLLGSDLRARAEERLLREAFGETYASYCRKTARFVPGLY